MPASSGQGGGGAGEIRAGGAYFEIEGRDKLSAVLGRLEDRAKGFVGVMSRVSGALTIGGVGALAAAAKPLSDAISTWIFGADDFEKRLADTVETGDRLLNKIKDIGQSTREWAGAESTRQGKADKFFDGLEAQRKSVEDLAQALKDAQAEEAKLYLGGGQDTRNFFKAVNPFGGKLEDERTAAAERVKEITKALKAGQAELNRTASDYFRAADPTANPEFRKTVDELRNAMNFATHPLGGPFEEQVRRMEAMFRGPTTETLFKDLIGSAKWADAKVKILEATKALEEYVKTQQVAQEQAGMTANEVALDNARRAGVSETKLDEARRQLGGPSLLTGTLLPVAFGLGNALKAAQQFKDYTKGGFLTPDAQRQFGIGDRGVQEQTSILKMIADGKGALPKKIADALIEGMKLK